VWGLVKVLGDVLRHSQPAEEREAPGPNTGTLWDNTDPGLLFVKMGQGQILIVEIARQIGIWREPLMKCPFCSSLMEKGVLRSRGGVFFLPDGEGLPRLYTKKEMEKHNAIYLPPRMLSFTAEYPVAHTCRTCGKIIIDFQK